MRPVIPYYGGKQRIASKIIKLIPKHTIYVEPFCGGSTILFKKPYPSITNIVHYSEVINDKDDLLINFYLTLKYNGEKFCELIGDTLYSRSMYDKARRVCKYPNKYNKITRAWGYYVNIVQSFSNKLNGSWACRKLRANSSGSWERRIKKINKYIERIQKVQIECDDALNVIKRWDSPQTFFYCDPPYPGTNQGHYSGYSLEDFKNLVNLLNECKGSFLLSNYEQDGVPDHWEKYEINTKLYVKKTNNKLEKRTEIIWKRNNIIEPCKYINDIYKSGVMNCFEG